jgi:hypothetical protein
MPTYNQAVGSSATAAERVDDAKGLPLLSYYITVARSVHFT